MAVSGVDQPNIGPAEKSSLESQSNIPEKKPDAWSYYGKFISIFSRSISIIGIIGLGALILFNVVDVIGSKTPLNWPLPGFVNLLGLSQLAAMSFAMGITFLAGQHIKVEIILYRFPKAFQGLVGILMNLLGLILFVLIIWRLMVLGQSFQKSHELVDVLFIPVYPFVYGMVLGFIPIFLALLYQFVNSVNRMVRR